MAISNVQLGVSKSDIVINPTDVKVTRKGDQIEFTANDSKFAVNINNDDIFFTDDIGEWKVDIPAGGIAITPKINPAYANNDKDYTISSSGLPDAPGRIIIGS
jgi:hypothetical protein